MTLCDVAIIPGVCKIIPLMLSAVDNPDNRLFLSHEISMAGRGFANDDKKRKLNKIVDLKKEIVLIKNLEVNSDITLIEIRLNF